MLAEAMVGSTLICVPDFYVHFMSAEEGRIPSQVLTNF